MFRSSNLVNLSMQVMFSVGQSSNVSQTLYYKWSQNQKLILTDKSFSKSDVVFSSYVTMKFWKIHTISLHGRLK